MSASLFSRTGATGLAVPTHVAIICHSGSLVEAQNLPPVCVRSPPASGASGCRSRRLFIGSWGVTKRETTAKFRRDCSSLHVDSLVVHGCRRQPVLITEWQPYHPPLP